MTREQWETQRQTLRADFLRMLGNYPAREPVAYEVLEPAGEFTDIQWQYLRHPASSGLTEYVMPDEDVDNPDYTRLRIRYPGVFPENPVTAYLRIPKNRTRPAPALLCLHGHVAGQFFGKEWQDVTASTLARRGFVTLAPDALPFGERRNLTMEHYEWQDNHPTSLFADERLWYQRLAFEGRSLMGVHVWELQRAIDILQAMPEVDGSRIGSIGHSGGGVNTVWIAALDERIACAVASAGVMEYARLAREHLFSAYWNYCPLLPVGDIQQLLSLVAPRPFLGIEGAHDSDFNGEYNRAHVYPAVREQYARYDAEASLVQHVHVGGHDYTDDLREMGYRWLTDHLQP
jgi:dienelactone hydrolase